MQAAGQVLGAGKGVIYQCSDAVRGIAGAVGMKGGWVWGAPAWEGAPGEGGR
ncbi:hypothetical protein [Kamptonema formosum]|uniref:hypothetical protein n=1 Tax=Kamptonema formosum TaxID=331992 RepID=UPI0003496CAF|nr:hypothetical protein [Oscillatoria sp. PCC 10802]